MTPGPTISRLEARTAFCTGRPFDALGSRVRVDYAPDGDHGREWLRGLCSDLEADGLVELTESDGRTSARLRR